MCRPLLLLGLLWLPSAHASVAPEGETTVVAILTIDRPETTVDLYGAAQLPEVLDRLTSGFRGIRLFLVIDTRSASNMFEVPAGATDREREAALANVAAAVVEAARGVPPGEAYAQAEAVRRRLLSEHAGNVEFVVASIFGANPRLTDQASASSLLDQERPPVVARGDMEPEVGVVLGGLWIVLPVIAGVLVLGSAGAWLLFAMADRVRRRVRRRSGHRRSTPAPSFESVPLPPAAPVARYAGDGAGSMEPRLGRDPIAPSRPSRQGDRPFYAMAGLMLWATGAMAQPAGGLDVRALDAACRDAEFVWVVDVSGSTDARGDAAQLIAPMVDVHGMTCVAVFGDSTRAVGVSDNASDLQRAVREAPTDGYTRVADAFSWAGELARAARREGRRPRIGVVSDFVDDDASGAVNAAFLPTLPPLDAEPNEAADTTEVLESEPATARPWWLLALALAAVFGYAGWWAGSRRRPEAGLKVVLDERSLMLYRGGAPELVRPADPQGALPDEPRLPLVTVGLDADGVLHLTAAKAPRPSDPDAVDPPQLKTAARPVF